MNSDICSKKWWKKGEAPLVSFEFEGYKIVNPTLDPTGRFSVEDPGEYYGRENIANFFIKLNELNTDSFIFNTNSHKTTETIKLPLYFVRELDETYAVEKVYANFDETIGGYGDIYSDLESLEKEHPQCKIIEGFVVVNKETGLIPDSCNEWNDYIKEAIKDYEQNIIKKENTVSKSISEIVSNASCRSAAKINEHTHINNHRTNDDFSYRGK